MFNNIYEEERLFPYLNISLEEARRLRYLISNFYAFKDGDLIQMSLRNIDGVVTANGLVYEQDKNKAFDSRIEYVDEGIDIYIVRLMRYFIKDFILLINSVLKKGILK